MFKSLYLKIMLLFAIFMAAVMAAVGTILMDSVYRFYVNEFSAQMEDCLSESSRSGLRDELISALGDNDPPKAQKAILTAYGTRLGIDEYRSFYILDMSGKTLAGSGEDQNENPVLTPNLISAMSGRDGNDSKVGDSYSDYAAYLTNGENSCVIYIKDTQEEMRLLSWQIFSLILKSIFIGLALAVALSFLLAKALTKPIRGLTVGAQAVMAGEFTHEITVSGADEIGVLTSTFNDMRLTLKSTFDEANRERMKLETVMANLKDAVIAYSDTGKVIQINDSARKLLGISDGTNIILDLSDTLSLLGVGYAEGKIDALSADKSVLDEGEHSERSSLTLREIVYGDRALDIVASAFKYYESDTAKNGIILVIHDVTSRYELDKAQREFVANVSHELRTPLTVIKGAAETLSLYPDMDPSMQNTFISNITDESDRMMRIVGDLLTLSRLDNRHTKWQISEFDMLASLRHICMILSADAGRRNQRIIFARSDKVPPVTGDKERIEQVIINIISNSIKYTQEGGEIRVWSRADKSRVYIYVRDNGVGIPPEDIPHLFERFYRVEKSRTADAGGTGLGLAIAKEIVVAHGGEITIRSKLGHGTETTIILPLKTTLADEAGS